MKKRVLAVILGAMMTTAGLTGCGGDTGSSESASEGQEMYTIGISQFAEHGSLDNCREGFIQGLEEEGLVEGENLVIKVNNADSDTATAAQIADTFVADKVDLICAIATPSAQAAYNSARNSEIPVVYTAVTNPEEAQLADDEGMPVGAVTGTSDQLPVQAQLEMIRELLPEAKTIGILYTTSEANSAYSISRYEKYAEETVAITTAASLTAPLVSQLGINPILLAQSCCIGAIACSYFNDSGFWVFNGMFGLGELRDQVKCKTAVSFIMTGVGIVELLILGAVL